MKQLNVKRLAQFAAAVVVVLSVACNKSGGGGSSNPAPVSQYGYNGSSCYDITTNVPVSQNLCAAVVINGAYRWDGVTCRDLNNNVAPNQASCYINGVLPGGVNGTGGYRWDGYTCRDINNNPINIPQAQCVSSNGTNTRFQIINGQCIDTVFLRQAYYSQCATSTGYNGSQCNGVYKKIKSYADGLFTTWYDVECYTLGNGTSTCSGQTLYDPITSTMKVCP